MTSPYDLPDMEGVNHKNRRIIVGFAYNIFVMSVGIKFSDDKHCFENLDGN